MKKFLPILVFALLILTVVQLGLTGGKPGQKTDAEQNSVSQNASSGEAQIGGDFTLTDQSGKTVHAADFHGKVMLVFFGFTHCPDICPATVATLSKTMALLGGNAEQVAPVFISVDPTRDTPAVLREFLANFDHRMVGLTGTPEQIRQVAEAYKAYYAKPDNAAGKPDYTIDHSAFIYMMGKDGKYIKIFPYNTSEQDLAHAIEPLLQ